MRTMETTNEMWADVPGFDGRYQVSKSGNVRSRAKVTKAMANSGLIDYRLLSFSIHHKGYYKVGLSRDGANKRFFVHRLVALAFIPNPDSKPQVNHINGVKTDNHADNLEWVTASENCIHKNRVLGHARPIESYRASTRAKARAKPIMWTVKTSKDHVCHGCGGVIPRGSKATYCKTRMPTFDPDDTKFERQTGTKFAHFWTHLTPIDDRCVVDLSKIFPYKRKLLSVSQSATD